MSRGIGSMRRILFADSAPKFKSYPKDDVSGIKQQRHVMMGVQSGKVCDSAVAFMV